MCLKHIYVEYSAPLHYYNINKIEVLFNFRSLLTLKTSTYLRGIKDTKNLYISREAHLALVNIKISKIKRREKNS